MKGRTDENDSEELSWWRFAVWITLLFIGGTRLMKGQPSLFAWSALVCGLVGVVYQARARSRAAARIKAAESEPVSIVFLLSEPRTVSADKHWIDQLGDAIGQKLNANGGESKEFLIPNPNPVIPEDKGESFLLKIREGMFWIINYREPYMDDPETFANKIADTRLRTAIGNHKAWISVDLLDWDGDFDRDAVYSILGKAVSALAGPDVVAVYCPELQRCNEFDPSQLPVLAGGKPLEVFAEATFAPVITIDDQDAQLKAATEEAKRRWPEFVAAFTSRDVSKEHPFIVKAPFSDKENTEFMWVEVTALDSEIVTGLLANTPHQLVGFREGQNVTIPAEAVVDWVCLGADGQRVGGWTQEVLMRQAYGDKLP